jgi:hypothetical protein
MTNNEQSNSSPIERAVMRRVIRISMLRYVINAWTASGLLLLITLYGIGRAVWVARVFENAPKDLPASAQFYLAAFSHTELIVQVLSVVALVSVFYLARATARLIASALVPARA